ncbi:MAG: YdcF family protein [Bacilli bacterium]|nr:YdcF family protein [Bacilli bacterium]
MKISLVDSNKLNDDLIKKIFFNIKKEQYNYADYLIIYGCHIKDMLDERLYHGLNIIQNKKVGKIVLTGGIGVNGDFNESEYMLNYLVSNGVDKAKVIVENKSTTTEENNLNIMNMLNLNKTNETLNIVLVTQQLHMLRIIMHWNKILDNNNIKFYYDYVDNSIYSYDNVINNVELKKVLKKQVDKMKVFIEEEKYNDIDIDNN